MFHSLKGIISGKTADFLYLETSGIEWALECSATTLSQLPKQGNEARVFIYLHHREDIMSLFGFSTLKEKDLFLNLISVSGIGPRAARRILSGITVEQFITALESEDVKSLTRLPGLGLKTAQKIILQLRGKLVKDSNEDIPGQTQSDNEWVQSLISMGFEKKNVQKTIAALEKDPELQKLSPEKKDQEFLRRAIVELSY